MSYLGFLDAFSTFLSSRLYTQLMVTFFSFFFVLVAVIFVIMGWLMCKDPETGVFFMDVSWIGSWVFVGGFLQLTYALITSFVLLVALRRYWTCPEDHRLFSLGVYMLLPMFPIGTVLSIYAISKLRTKNSMTTKTW